MRVVVAALVVVALTLAVAQPVAASCAPPVPLADDAARAVAVVYGTVTSVESGALTLRVDRVLKGPAGATLRVFVGPGRGGTAGSAVITSVDYPDMSGKVQVGSDHVLYLNRGSDGALETNACTGSHAGPPTADEVAYFGAGTSPGGSTTPAPSPAPGDIARAGDGPGSPERVAQISAIWPLLILAIVGGATIVVLRRRAA